MHSSKGKAGCQAEMMHGHTESLGRLHRITALPQSLLELILIQGTSSEDKKALRQTCKLFLQTLDSRLSRIKVRSFRCLDDLAYQKNFLQRMQNVPGLRSIILTGKGNSLHEHLPAHITALRIYGWYTDLTKLRRLSCLTVLSLRGACNKGMEHVCGLTRLDIEHRGSVAHLAPTLKHLKVRTFTDVQGIQHLTSLEVLEVQHEIPADFFITHQQLPLKHLSFTLSKYGRALLANSTAWAHAPTTLTCLTLTGEQNTFPVVMHMLPASITHLQLLHVRDKTVKRVIACITELKRLDLHLCSQSFTVRGDALSHLSKLTSLQSLRLSLYDADSGIPWHRDKAFATLSEIPRAIERGVTVSENELLDVLSDPLPLSTMWTV